MVDIYRIRATWTGMPGAPGVSTFYDSGPPSASELTAIRTFFNSLAAGLPNTLTISVQGTGDVVTAEDGELVGGWSATAPSTVVGTSASGYGAPVGTCVHWTTGVVAHGRRVRGTTYIVPTVNQYEPGGTPIGTWVTTVQTAANALVTAMAGNLIVWHRPKFGPKPGPGIPRPVIRTGSVADVTGTSVPDKAVVLRSRRD